MKKIKQILLISFLMISITSKACSILYYVDAKTGKIYVVNNEDYFLDVNAYIQIEPKTKRKYARLWYGWDDFAQGGINEKGLFFDGATTPKQKKVKGSKKPKGNLGDKILANCSTVEEALAYLTKKQIALDNAHMMFGDKTGNAVVVEWVNGERKLNWIKDNKLIATNYLLSSTKAGNYPCYRYKSIEDRIKEMEENKEDVTLLKVGNTFGQAGQIPQKTENERMAGTLYTSFIDITDNKFFLSYKLSNKNVIKLDLSKEFPKKKRQKIELKD